MNELRMILVAALCGAFLVACGDDDRPTPVVDMGPRDMNVTDLGPAPDLGPSIDGGTRDGGAAGMCPAGACDLVANGCPAGEGCYFLSAGPGMAAMPLCQTSGIGVSGATCMMYTECAAGFTCMGATATVPGTCEKYCCAVGSSAGCPAGAMCSIVLTDMTGMPTGAALCNAASNCAIFGTDCAAGEGCYTIGGDGTTDCAMAGTLTAGMECMFTNDCAVGFTCLGFTGMPSTCHKNCDTADMDPGCTGTDTCVSRALPAPLTNLGVCTPPP